MEAIANFFVSTGFYQFFQGDNWKSAIMLVIAVVLLFLGIVKKFEPLLLVPIAFGMLVTNLPGAEMFHEILFAGGHVHWDLFGGEPITAQFLSEMLANGVSADMLQPYADSLMTAAQSTFDPGVLDNLMAQLAASGSEAVGTLSNQLDAAVLEGDLRSPSLTAQEIGQDRLRLICSPDHPLAQAGRIAALQLPAQAFLLREKGSAVRDLFDQRMGELGLAVEPLWESVSTQALIHAAALGLGISVLPETLVQPALDAGQIVCAEADGLDLTRRLWLVRRKSKYVSPQLQAFFDIVGRAG